MTAARAVAALLEGLSITFRKLWEKPRTIEYPDVEPPHDRWRGVHGLFFTEDATEELCVSCDLCARVCPAQAISMEGKENPDGSKTLTRFDVDLGRCVYCGFCEEVCPVEAIRLTPSWDYVSRDRAGLVLHKEDLLEIGRMNQEREGRPGWKGPAE